jgi:hypothetical protein
LLLVAAAIIVYYVIQYVLTGDVTYLEKAIAEIMAFVFYYLLSLGIGQFAKLVERKLV